MQAYALAVELVVSWQAGNARATPRLRDFQPALVGCALSGDAARATQLTHLMRHTCKLDLTGVPRAHGHATAVTASVAVGFVG
jgi:hypothetical protein